MAEVRGRPSVPPKNKPIERENMNLASIAKDATFRYIINSKWSLPGGVIGNTLDSGSS
jgi:hypothetical protein